MTRYQLIFSHDVQSCDEYLNRQANYSVFHRPSGKINADSALEFLWQIDEDNCKNKDYEELNLKGDISWGAEKQFENEALMAVRTANFLSAFLQVCVEFESCSILSDEFRSRLQLTNVDRLE